MFMRRPHQGFTMVELLVTISIMAILAALLLPAVTLVKNKANQATNGNNQKQIVAAMISYQGEYDQRWPLAVWGANVLIPVATTAPALTGATGRLVAYASMETVAALAQLPNKIFMAKGQKELVVGGAANTYPHLLSTYPNFGSSQWSSRNAGGGEIAWAYDFCAPVRVSSYRVILADRGNWHKTRVLAVVSDTSIRVFDAGTGTDGDTFGMNGAVIPANTIGATVNLDANFGGANGEISGSLQDFIYTGAGDGGTVASPLAAGNTLTSNGDARRAWVK